MLRVSTMEDRNNRIAELLNHILPLIFLFGGGQEVGLGIDLDVLIRD